MSFWVPCSPGYRGPIRTALSEPSPLKMRGTAINYHATCFSARSMPPSHRPAQQRVCTKLAIKRTTSPQESDYFYTGWNLEDYNWDLGELGGEGRPDLGGGPGANIPLGPRDIPVFTSVPVLPTLVSKPQGQPSAPVPEPPPRPLPAPVPPELPPVFTQGPISASEKDNDMDLGSIITGVAGSYFDAKYNPGQIRTVGNQPTYGTGGLDGSVIPTTPADLGVPFVDVIPEPPSDCPGGQYLWKPATATCAGKWIKRSRRRRRKLVTDSDIKGIAALRTVGGPALVKTWIATHSS